MCSLALFSGDTGMFAFALSSSCASSRGRKEFVKTGSPNRWCCSFIVCRTEPFFLVPLSCGCRLIFCGGSECLRTRFQALASLPAAVGSSPSVSGVMEMEGSRFISLIMSTSDWNAGDSSAWSFSFVERLALCFALDLAPGCELLRRLLWLLCCCTAIKNGSLSAEGCAWFSVASSSLSMSAAADDLLRLPLRLLLLLGDFLCSCGASAAASISLGCRWLSMANGCCSTVA